MTSQLGAFNSSVLKAHVASGLNARGSGVRIIPESTFRIEVASFSRVEVWSNTTAQDGAGQLLHTLNVDRFIVWGEFAQRFLNQMWANDSTSNFARMTPFSTITEEAHVLRLMFRKLDLTPFNPTVDDEWGHANPVGVGQADWEFFNSNFIIGDNASGPSQTGYYEFEKNVANTHGRINFNDAGGEDPIVMAFPNTHVTGTAFDGRYPRGMFSVTLDHNGSVETELDWGITWADESFPLSTHADGYTTLKWFGAVNFVSGV